MMFYLHLTGIFGVSNGTTATEVINRDVWQPYTNVCQFKPVGYWSFGNVILYVYIHRMQFE